MNMDLLSRLIQENRIEEAEILVADLLEKGEVVTIPKFWILVAVLCFNVGDGLTFFEALKKCVQIDDRFYETYILLGDYYRIYDKNDNKAFLCYEHGLEYCTNDEDRIIIQNMMKECAKSPGFFVRKFSIIILSYNHCSMMKELVRSIRTSCKSDNHEIIVVDSASTDGIKEWLEEQEDIILKITETYEGFAFNNNLGVELSSGENDLFFLNNDTYVPEHSIFYLRLALYSSEDVGAVGPMTNYEGSTQLVYDFPFGDIKKIEQYFRNANIPWSEEKMPYEKSVYLSGFAIFVKREVYDQIEGWDTRYRFGNYEDDDLCIQILLYGARLLIVHNSFILHYGNQSMGEKKTSLDRSLDDNKHLFCEKWGFDIGNYKHMKTVILPWLNNRNKTF